MTTAFLFPGQGSQAIGMGSALAAAFPAAKEVFQEVDDALGQHLFKLMAEGPESDLNLTENTQPAIMACSAAALRVMQHELGDNIITDPAYVAGHSLGEYAALLAAQSLSISEAARLLKIRGQAMQQAVPVGEGAMAAILGLDFTALKELCDTTPGICEIANYNTAQQIVVSGTTEAVEAAMQTAKEKGAKRAILLPVSAPFHCSLMQPAAARMEEALASAAIQDASVPVIANVTAQPVQDAAQIKSRLVEQVTGMVRWQETIDYLLAQGVSRFVEIGHGKVLSGMLKRQAPDAQVLNVGTPEDIDALDKA